MSRTITFLLPRLSSYLLLLLLIGAATALKLRALPLRRGAAAVRPATFRPFRRLDVPEEVARKRSGGAVEVPPALLPRRPQQPSSSMPNDFQQQQQQQHSKTNGNTENDWWTKAKRGSNSNSKKERIVITDPHQLRRAVLDEKVPLKHVQVNLTVTESDAPVLLDHQVVQLLAQRFQSKSQPGARDDPYTLALCMEGGGMRGAVSAGMAAAIASLGLTDAFDKVYGSSAGSVIGAYMIR